MTDNEIIKGFEYCFTNDFGKTNCNKCVFYTATAKCMDDMQNAVIDLINRQKNKIKRLKNENKILSIDADTAFQDGLNEAQDLYAEQVKDEIRTEAIKEFAERVKKELRLDDDCSYDCENCCFECKEFVPQIDKLVKEMTEVEVNQRKEDEGK